MAELKTKKNNASVEDFLNGVEQDQKREDSFAIAKLMSAVTGDEGKMWGTSIVGYGKSITHYANGKTGEWMATGFSPRKNALTLYIMSGFDEYESILERLGKHKIGKSCLYVKKLSDIDMDVLRELVTRSVEHVSASE